MSEFLSRLEVGAEPKISELQGGLISLVAEQEVLGLDVSVHDTQLVQMLHHLHHCAEVICVIEWFIPVYFLGELFCHMRNTLVALAYTRWMQSSCSQAASWAEEPSQAPPSIEDNSN